MSPVRSHAVPPMSLCIDKSPGAAAPVRARGTPVSGTARALGGRRAAAFELHEDERGRDRARLAALAPLVAVLLDAPRALEHVRQQAGQRLPSLFVERQRR